MRIVRIGRNSESLLLHSNTAIHLRGAFGNPIRKPYITTIHYRVFQSTMKLYKYKMLFTTFIPKRTVHIYTRVNNSSNTPPGRTPDQQTPKYNHTCQRSAFNGKFTNEHISP